MKFLVKKRITEKNTGKMRKNTGKVREFCQSGKVGTLLERNYIAPELRYGTLSAPSTNQRKQNRNYATTMNESDISGATARDGINRSLVGMGADVRNRKLIPAAYSYRLSRPSFVIARKIGRCLREIKQRGRSSREDGRRSGGRRQRLAERYGV